MNEITSDFIHSNMMAHLAFNLAFGCSTKVHLFDVKMSVVFKTEDKCSISI